METKRIWKVIWRWKGLERIRVFMWQAAHGRLLTANRRSRMMRTDPNCHRCHRISETGLHALRDCPYAASIWIKASVSNYKEAIKKKLIRAESQNLQNRQQAWEPPPRSWVKLNTDGSVNEEAKKSGCRELLNAKGGVDWRFHCKLGILPDNTSRNVNSSIWIINGVEFRNEKGDCGDGGHRSFKRNQHIPTN
ncbi:hypothetical protein AHAS_Ahas13G0241000 [Arachis hypogaea]